MRLDGYNANGEYWYQLEEYDHLEKPYINSYGYQFTLSECTAANHSQPKYIYEWIYQCLYDADSVTRRTIVTNNGNTTRVLENDFTYDQNPGKEMSIHINVPMWQFYNLIWVGRDEAPGGAYSTDNYSVYPIFRRVVNDNPHLFAYGRYISTATMSATSRIDTIRLITLPVAERNRCQAVVDRTVSDIDRIIYSCTRFTPNNPPTTTMDRVKVAKVIYDYLVLHNKYENDSRYYDQTMYSALAPEETPVCTSYALTFAYVAKRYNIMCFAVSGILDRSSEARHAWVVALYEYGADEYPLNDNTKNQHYCLVEMTFDYDDDDEDVDKLKGWRYFNIKKSDGEYLQDSNWIKIPALYGGVTDYQYNGKSIYSWDLFDREVHYEQFLRTILGGIKEWGEREFSKKQDSPIDLGLLEDIADSGIVCPVADNSNKLFTDKEGNIYVL